jgi:hypothetical protein
MWFIDLMLMLSAIVLGAFSFKPLKASSEYRFQKKKPLFEGLAFLGTAALAVVFWSWWAILIGAPIAWGIRRMNRSDRKLLGY